MTKSPDVHFIFEEGNDVLRIPTNKDVLAASSPVFNAMFNGDLTETGDVKMVNASSAAFKDLLQFFYSRQVQLTMDNIAEVLKLIDKYDVADAIPICVDFLKDNLTISDILWGLNLAVMFHLDELKAFCTGEIQRNSKVVWNMFEIRDDGQMFIFPKPMKRSMSKEDANRIFPHLFVALKSVISNLFDESKQNAFSFCLTGGLPFENITEQETIQFSLSKSMQLTKVLCSEVFSKLCASRYVPTNHTFEMTIEKDAETLFSSKIELSHGTNQVKFSNPIKIDPNCTYSIVMKSCGSVKNIYTYRAILPQEPVLLKLSVRISFPNVSGYVQRPRSLISHLFFE